MILAIMTTPAIIIMIKIITSIYPEAVKWTKKKTKKHQAITSIVFTQGLEKWIG